MPRKSAPVAPAPKPTALPPEPRPAAVSRGVGRQLTPGTGMLDPTTAKPAELPKISRGFGSSEDTYGPWVPVLQANPGEWYIVGQFISSAYRIPRFKAEDGYEQASRDSGETIEVKGEERKLYNIYVRYVGNES